MAPGVVRLNRLITLVAMVVVTITTATSAPVLKNTGSVAAVKGLVQRVFSAYEFASPFEFKLIGDTTCKGIKPPCFAVADLPGGKIRKLSERFEGFCVFLWGFSFTRGFGVRFGGLRCFKRGRFRQTEISR